MKLSDKQNLIDEFKKVLDGREEFSNRRLERYQDESGLNEYGMWSKGYWQGYQAALDSLERRFEVMINKMEVEDELE